MQPGVLYCEKRANYLQTTELTYHNIIRILRAQASALAPTTEVKGPDDEERSSQVDIF